MSASSSKFLNPPLLALAFGSSELERIETLIQWAIIKVGSRALEHWQERLHASTPQLAINHWHQTAIHQGHKTGDPAWRAIARLENLAREHGIRDKDVDGHIWALGVETLGLNPAWKDARACLDAHQRLEAFTAQMQERTGRIEKDLCIVSGLKMEWVLSARRACLHHGGEEGERREASFPPHPQACIHHCSEEGERLGYSHLAVLCAVLSKIGSKKSNPKRCAMVTWPEIQRRALGYVNEAEMSAALPYRQDGALPLSRDQIDCRTKQLASMRFILRHVPRIGGKCLPAWYGSGLDQAALVKFAEEAKLRRAGGWKARWKRQQAGQTAMAVQNVIAFEPDRDVNVTAPVRQGRAV